MLDLIAVRKRHDDRRALERNTTDRRNAGELAHLWQLPKDEIARLAATIIDDTKGRPTK